MQLPPDILKRIEDISFYFGGLEEVVQSVREDTLVTLAMFNGPIGTISSFIKEDQESFELEPAVLNLNSIDYEGGLYRVLTKDKKLLYSDTGTLTESGDLVFGLSLKDRMLINEAAHGEFVYIYFNSRRGPQLAAIWICKRLPRWVKETVLERWDSLRSVSRGEMFYNEMFIKTDLLSNGSIEIISAEGSWNSYYNREYLEKLLEKGQADLISIDIEREVEPDLRLSYLRFKAGRWFYIRARKETGELVPLSLTEIEGIGSDRVREARGVYYISGGNMQASWLFSSGKAGSAPVIGSSFEAKHIRIYARALESINQSHQ